MKTVLMEILDGIAALRAGFRTTFIHLFRKSFTEEYPEYKRPLPLRSRAESFSPRVLTVGSAAWPAICVRLFVL